MFCLIFSLFSFNKYKNTGNVQTFTAPCAANYKLEVWGAQGSNDGGKGGYAFGTTSFSSNAKTYICVGGKGKIVVKDKVAYTSTGGYNGGGYGDQGGGGATHMASTNRGVLSKYESYKSEVFNVAGGGGGADGASSKGHGGGTVGNDTGDHIAAGGVHYPSGKGGTQTAGGEGVQNGSFGQGGSLVGRENVDSAGGGGGGWYGGGSSRSPTIGDGGGGSGHINSSVLSNSGMQNGQREGDGFAIITWHPAL